MRFLILQKNLKITIFFTNNLNHSFKGYLKVVIFGLYNFNYYRFLLINFIMACHSVTIKNYFLISFIDIIINWVNHFINILIIKGNYIA